MRICIALISTGHMVPYEVGNCRRKMGFGGDRLIVTPRDLVATIATRSVSQRPGRDYPPERILVGWKGSGHAALPFWLCSNSVPLIQMACMMIASFLATATAARLKPLRL